MFLKECFLEIGGFCIKLFSEDKSSLLYMDSSHEAFLTNNKEPDVSVSISEDVPFNINEATAIFKAKSPFCTAFENDKTHLWSVYAYNNKNYIACADPLTGEFPNAYATFPQETKSWHIFVKKNTNNNGEKYYDPMAYPMGLLLLYHLALYNNAIMIHASGVSYNDKGFLFTGFSGTGKSTMANLWHKEGHTIINDDRLLIRNIDGKYCIFNTPMVYADVPKKAILNTAFLLKQHPENYLREVTGTEKITRFMAFCIQHHYDKTHIQKIMNTVNDIVNHIGVYELGFVPNNTVVKLLSNGFR